VILRIKDAINGYIVEIDPEVSLGDGFGQLIEQHVFTNYDDVLTFIRDFYSRRPNKNSMPPKPEAAPKTGLYVMEARVHASEDNPAEIAQGNTHFVAVLLAVYGKPGYFALATRNLPRDEAESFAKDLLKDGNRR
jgi:hypothetical protein